MEFDISITIGILLKMIYFFQDENTGSKSNQVVVTTNNVVTTTTVTTTTQQIKTIDGIVKNVQETVTSCNSVDVKSEVKTR